MTLNRKVVKLFEFNNFYFWRCSIFQFVLLVGRQLRTFFFHIVKFLPTCNCDMMVDNIDQDNGWNESSLGHIKNSIKKVQGGVIACANGLWNLCKKPSVCRKVVTEYLFDRGGWGWGSKAILVMPTKSGYFWKGAFFRIAIPWVSRAWKDEQNLVAQLKLENLQNTCCQRCFSRLL